ncbi:MAG: hypothetical protein V7736_17385 [Colwellia polaris]|uniref:hypothetical protein n=1 Tax=Colwellia polaris TaxID=326537 RepID=UPI001177CA5E|nr:hypothetical protein [Colwellia polaris]
MMGLLAFFAGIGVCNAGNNSGKQDIYYYKIDSQRIVIYVPSGIKFIDNANCNGTNEAIAVSISAVRDNFAELYASIMLAHANNRKIAFWLDGTCTPAMAGGPFPTASMVYVY